MKSSGLPFAVAGILAVVAIVLAVVFNMNQSSNISATKDDVTAMKIQLTAIQAQLGTITSQASVLDQKLTAQSTQTNDVNTQLTALKAQDATQAATITAMQTQLKAASDAVAALKDQVTFVGTQITDVKTSNTTATSQVTDLQTKLTSLTAQLTTLQTTVTTLQSQVQNTGGYNNYSGIYIPASVSVSAGADYTLITYYNTSGTNRNIVITGNANSAGGRLWVYNVAINTSFSTYPYAIELPLSYNTNLAVPVYPGYNTIYLRNNNASGTLTATFNTSAYLQ